MCNTTMDGDFLFSNPSLPSLAVSMVLSLFVQFPLVFHHTARCIQEIKRVLRLRAGVTLGLNLDLVYSVSHRGLLRCHAPPSKRPRCLTLWNKERRLQTLASSLRQATCFSWEPPSFSRYPQPAQCLMILAIALVSRNTDQPPGNMKFFGDS